MPALLPAPMPTEISGYMPVLDPNANDLQFDTMKLFHTPTSVVNGGRRSRSRSRRKTRHRRRITAVCGCNCCKKGYNKCNCVCCKKRALCGCQCCRNSCTRRRRQRQRR